MPENYLYLTELVGAKVYDLRNRVIGRVRDAGLVPLIHPSRVDRYLVGGRGWTWLTIRHDQVAKIDIDGLWLRDEKLGVYHDDEYMLRLVRDLLDQQIIDALGRKVVRVTDITLEIVTESDGHQELHVLEVDIGLRSIFRRLFQGILPPRWIRKLQRPIPPHSIPWQFCDILEPDPQRRLRLNISYELLEKMHPADLADIFEELSPEDRGALVQAIDSHVAAEALSEVEPDIQASILESLDPHKAAEILEEMAPDAAADLIAELEPETGEEILEEMDQEPRAEVEELLDYPPDTAGGLMNPEFVALHENATVSDALAALRARPDLVDNLHALYLIDQQERLVGVVPLARLFLAEGSTPLRQLAVRPVVKVNVREKRDWIVELFDKYNLFALPVVDQEDKLVGVITADDIIALLRSR